MGIYLNPGKAAYEIAVNSEIYIDKTEMIRYLNSTVNTQQRFVSVSRPRRFGKTMAADMISAYYDRMANSRELFENRLLTVHQENNQDWDVYLGKFDVIRLAMTDFLHGDRTVREAISIIQKRIIGELEELYPDTKYDPLDFYYSINRFYQNSKRQFVIVIDEWDAIFREYPEDTEGQRLYLDFLRDWLKDKPYVALAYMTGILPIKKYGRHSALNMFTEYSMMSPRQLAPYTGFTEDEVKGLCEKYRMDYYAVSDWYDGYVISGRIAGEKREEYREGKYDGHKISIYSPLSVVESMLTGRIGNYWNKTETYEALAEFIRRDYDGLKEAVTLLMDGGRIEIDSSTYQNDMTTFNGRDDILSLLVHIGYLGFDDETSEVFIPNREILDEFRTSTKGNEWIPAFKEFERSQKLLKATWEKDAGKVSDYLEDAHNQAGNKTYNDEAALSYAIRLAYYAARKYYTEVLELDSGKGYADIAYIPAPKYPDIPALVIELKYNQTADTALNQIRRQKYPDRLAHYEGNILLVAVNYDRDVPNTNPGFKHHSCRIEEA
jgi:hypothetical protein